MTRQILDSAVGTFQRGQSLVVTLTVSNQMQGNQQIVGNITKRMRPRDMQRVSVQHDRIWVVISFFQSPFVRNLVITVVHLHRFCRRVLPGAAGHPESLGPCTRLGAGLLSV